MAYCHNSRSAKTRSFWVSDVLLRSLAVEEI